MRRRLFLAALLIPGVTSCASPPPADALRSVVFFVADSAALDEGAQSIIRQSAETALANAGPVRVLGFAGSTVGTAAFNRNLARTRAQAVMDGLIAAGVPANRVSMGARAAVPFEQMPTEARRVEIVFGS